MKIVIHYTKENQQSKSIRVASAHYIGDYALRILFNNRQTKLVDFKAFLEKSKQPSIKKYMNEKYFKKFKIVHGNINWNDYEMIFPVEDLYEGKI